MFQISSIQRMFKKEAQKQLNIGYALLLGGVVVGLGLDNKGGNNTLNPLLFGYLFWSIYWGYKIAYRKVSMQFSKFFNTPVHITARGTGDFFSKSIVYKLTSEFIKFWICYFIGALGGGIIQQVKLSKIAYLN